jgi:phage portal protein BeeE
VTLLDRVLGRQPARKAVMGGPYLAALASGPLLSVTGTSYQEKAAAYLRAYKSGWFYKAESRISRDLANLSWTLSYEDSEGDNAEEIVAPSNSTPFERLDPLEQFLRLSERPNPWQTGRQLKQQSQIRLDMTGRALIYLEGGDGGGLPTAMYGISPSRMWPSNKQGQLVGWVLDRNSPGGGVPFSAEEILVVEYVGVDDPVGVIEAVYAQVPLTDLVARHVGDVLTTGGRLAGMAWPKTRSLDEDEYQDVLRAWRNVASDPNAARRLLVFPEPMDFDKGAATPTELGIPELSPLTRDEILTAFPVSPYMLGVPMPHGLASGEQRREERHEYWEGTQHPRVEIWEDAIQQQLIGRYEQAVGRPLDMDIEEPNLDDAATLTEKATAYQSLVAIGFDAKDSVAAVGLDHIKWNGLPSSIDPVEKQKRAEQMAAQLAGADARPAAGGRRSDTAPDAPGCPRTAATAAATPSATRARQGAHARTAGRGHGRRAAGLHEAVHAALIDQRQRLIPLIEASLPKSKSARQKALPDDWWDPKRERSAFLKALQTAYLRLTRGALEVVANNVGRVVLPTAVRPITSKLLESAGLRIDDINETTRSAIVDTLTEGTQRGYSIQQLVHGVPDEAFGGLHDLKLANGGPAWDTLRAETIARTETMLAYNEAALRGYGEFDVKQVTAIDGDEDEECASRDGQTYDLDEALDISDHPNGTLDWVPVT